jgi:phosphatidate cytidylyltransferase
VLERRVLTAVVLGSITVAVVLSGSKVAFSLLTGLIVIVAAWEWAGLSGLQLMEQRVPYLVIITVLLSVSYGIQDTPWLQGIVVAGLLWWCCACVIVIAFQRGKVLIPSHRLITATTGIFVLIPAWSSLVILYAANDGPRSVMFLFLLIWTADIAAYFIGSRWGSHSLASRISPGKSWEGVAGGILMAALPAWGYVILGKIEDIDIVRIFFLCLVTVGFSVIGDLFESMCKRNALLKDSSRLLPGHGGVLDRIDSLTAAAPVFVIGFSFLGGGT